MNRIALFCLGMILVGSACGDDANDTFVEVRDALMEEVEKACRVVVDEFAECANRVNEGEVTAEERGERIDECVFNNHSYTKGEIDCLESCEEDLTCEKKMDASNCDCENRCGTGCTEE